MSITLRAETVKDDLGFSKGRDAGGRRNGDRIANAAKLRQKRGATETGDENSEVTAALTECVGRREVLPHHPRVTPSNARRYGESRGAMGGCTDVTEEAGTRWGSTKAPGKHGCDAQTCGW